jgi:DNA-binding response OmpR family regulator
VTGQPVSTRDVPAIVELAPGLIILDLLTGSEEVGLVLLQMLKMTPSTRTIPVVLCAGVDAHVEAMRWLLDPIGVWIVDKPFTPEALLTAITAALSNAAPSVTAKRVIASQNGSTDHESPRNY